MGASEFDRYSSSYDDLLKDPLRDRFTGNESLFFHQRKCQLIQGFLGRRKMDPSGWSYLDVGCGKGELLSLLRQSFARAAGCDVSADMMTGLEGVETRLQADALKIPFADGEFDFVTAVCVYHHVPLECRQALTTEIVRVLRPGGLFCVIEHNPRNPVTRLIVSRTPVDANAILLRAAEAEEVMSQSGLRNMASEYFLYFPKRLYGLIGWSERLLAGIPFGGQYAVFGQKPA